jgi:2-polyprenyl-6-hydroxyphenyl methylase/3-demethylubiquinone-9 3-methyltransferase
MADDSRSQKFLVYTQNTQDPAARIQPSFMDHYRAIRAEMQRRGTWREGARLLDLGCGLGLYSEFWHDRGFKVTGVDMNGQVLSVANQRGATRSLPIRYSVGAADRLPFADCSFDIVFANSLLEHVTDWETSVQEWVRVLAPGGLLWIETTNVICPHQREFRLPVYSWWPPFMKRVAERLARGPWPVLANYTEWPAIHWFSFFQLRNALARPDMVITDRFDGMDVRGAGLAKRIVRNVAVSSRLGRLFGYLFVSTVIIMATKQAAGVRS